nr:hypothetical protein [uncultured Brevundimonas sp.]
MGLSADHAALLRAVAEALMQARGRIDGVEAMVSDLIGQTAPENRAPALVQAQALDVLGQEIEALSGVLHRLGQGDAPDLAVDATPLSDLSARLGAVVGLSRDHTSDTNEIELF